MSDTPGQKILEEGLGVMGITLDDQARRRLLLFCAELLRWSSKINLVAKAELREIWESHFFDSLSLLTRGCGNLTDKVRSFADALHYLFKNFSDFISNIDAVLGIFH